MSGDNFMGGVVITAGSKKETTWIDPEGNILDVEQSPKGLIIKGIKEKNEPGYIPTKEEIEHVINLPKEPAKLPDDIQKFVNHPIIETKTEIVKTLPIQQQI